MNMGFLDMLRRMQYDRRAESRVNFSILPFETI